jgi:hypothetical protein
LQRLQVTGGAYVSGNLGIGTTTPTSKLQVVGDTNVSGVVTAFDFYNTAEYPNVRPTLDLAFAQTKILDSRITFTRASTATYVGFDRTIKTAAVNEPRFDHNPTTGESLGLLVEEQRTNLLLRSEEFNTTWPTGAGSGNFVVTANDAIAPNGSLTADRGTDTVDGSNQAHQTSQGVALVSGLAYTASVYAKLDTAGGLTLGFAGSGAFSTEQRVSFNLVDQTSAIQLGTPTNLSIVAVGDGWYRVSASFTATASGTGLLVIRILNSSQSGFYQGTGSQSLFLWGAQLEAGAFLTSYIPTTTAAVTRSADVASITNADLLPWFTSSLTDHTFYVEARSGGTTTNATLLEGYEGASLKGLSISLPSRPRIIQRHGASRFDTASQAADIGVGNIARIAVVTSSNSSSALNGSAVSVGSPPAQADWTAGSSLSIGSRAAGASLLFTGTIQRLTYWPVRLPNAQLQTITL